MALSGISLAFDGTGSSLRPSTSCGAGRIWIGGFGSGGGSVVTLSVEVLEW